MKELLFLANPKRRKRARKATRRTVARKSAPRRRRSSRKRRKTAALAITQPTMKIRRRRKSTTRRRRSYKRNPFAMNPKRRKRSSRRRFKRNPFSLKSLSPSGLFSGGVVKEAAGAVGSTFVSSFVLGKFGSYLPGSNNNFARAGYRLGLHFAIAPLVSKFGGPDAGRGVKLAGFIAALTEILKPTNALGAQAAALNPLGVMPIQPVGDYVPRRLPGRALPPLRPLSAVNTEAFNAYN